MKIKRLFTLLALFTIFTIPVLSVSSQSATNSAVWTSAIAYQNTSSTAGNLVVNFYNAGGSTFATASIPLPANGNGILQTGAVTTSPSLPSGFAGSAVLSADVAIASTYLQIDSTPEYGRVIYNGFSGTDASTSFSIPTFLKQAFNTTTRVGIQNVSSSSATVTLNFYAAGSPPTLAHSFSQSVPAQSSYIFSGNDIAALAVGFNGSLSILSSQAVVATAIETQDSGRAAYAFEGVKSGATTVYVPTTMCSAFSSLATSRFAIQAVGGPATFTITNNLNDGSVVTQGPYTISTDGGKMSVDSCVNTPVIAAGKYGASTFTASSGNIVVVVKVQSANGMRTAYTAPATGGLRLALPYVQWGQATYNTPLAAQNIGTVNTDITFKYYNNAGTLVGSQSFTAVIPGAKVNSNPALGGVAGAFSGSVIVESTVAQIAATARAQSTVSFGAVTILAEDYLGIPQ